MNRAVGLDFSQEQDFLHFVFFGTVKYPPRRKVKGRETTVEFGIPMKDQMCSSFTGHGKLICNP